MQLQRSMQVKSLYISDLWRSCQLATLSGQSSSALKSTWSSLAIAAELLPASATKVCTTHSGRTEWHTCTSKWLINSKHGYSKRTNSSWQCMDLKLLAGVWFSASCSRAGKLHLVWLMLSVSCTCTNLLARSASYWTIHRCGDNRGPKQHLTTED